MLEVRLAIAQASHETDWPSKAKVIIDINKYLLRSEIEVSCYTQQTHLNMQSMTLENFGNFLEQKYKNTKKH